MPSKVLLVVIDALASRVVNPAMEQGRLPHLRALAEAGQVAWNCTSIFPSITPAATCTLVTGCYPNEHGIGGAYWYDKDSDEVCYYGDDIWPILRKGTGQFFEDFLVRLNERFLRTETTFQQVESAGMRAGCLNYLWFYGTVEHNVSVPWLMSLVTGTVNAPTVHGPTVLALGDFVTTRLELTGEDLKGRGGVTRRFGFHDDTTADLLLQLAKDGPLPNFTVAYFPNNDYESHARGPAAAVDKLEDVDRHLGELFAVYGGLSAMLEEVAVVITGDHSQSDMKEGVEEASIELETLLQDYNIVPAGDKWGEEDELMICPNMRAAQIYLRRSYRTARGPIIDRLLSESRVDQVIWREQREGAERFTFHVATNDRGRLTFWPGKDGDLSALDCYGGHWSWTGDLRAVDGHASDEGTIHFEEYPNAFERILCAFDDHVTGDIWLTSRVGYEFRLPATSIHDGGGSHASLHQLDSTVPLIVAGVPDGFLLPDFPRAVDVAPVCLSLLGLKSARDIGASHIRPSDSKS